VRPRAQPRSPAGACRPPYRRAALGHGYTARNVADVFDPVPLVRGIVLDTVNPNGEADGSYPTQARIVELVDNRDGTLSVVATVLEADAPLQYGGRLDSSRALLVRAPFLLSEVAPSPLPGFTPVPAPDGSRWSRAPGRDRCVQVSGVRRTYPRGRARGRPMWLRSWPSRSA
jgi:hypothetical protein